MKAGFLDNESFDALQGTGEYVSPHALNIFHGSVSEYRARYVDQSFKSKHDSSALAFGRAVHIALLEPEKFDSSVAIKEKGSVEELDNVIFVSQEDMMRLQQIQAAAFNHPAIRSILEAPKLTEQGAWAIEPYTDVKLKGKLDLLTLKCGDVYDIKTTRQRTVEGFAKDAGMYGYHRALAVYKIIAKELAAEGLIERSAQWPRIIVLSTTMPCDVWLAEFPQKRMKQAYGQVIDILGNIASRRETEDWSSPLSSSIQSLEAADWFFK